MSKTGISIALGAISVATMMATAPLSSQAIPGGPVPQNPPADRPSGGGGGGIGFGLTFNLGKKKPKAPPAPPMEMVDADIPDFVADEALFFFSGDAKAAAKIARAANVEIIEMTPIDELGETMVRVRLRPGDTVEAAVDRLSRQPGVTSAQPNFLYQLLGKSAREKGVAQHGLNLGKTTVSGTILMIDSVVDIGNPALAGAHISQQIVADDATASAHGTAVAEILVGTGKGSSGVGGVARGATLISIAAFEPAGEKSWLSTTAKLTKASNAALKAAPNVVNLSFGAKAFDPKLDQMMGAFETRGVCVVAAAGNDKGAVKFPARRSTAIAVTAVSGNGKTVYAAASKGPEIDVAAWGVGMLAATPDGWRSVSGTSFATAVVSGGLLRLHGCNGGKAPAATRQFLSGAAKDLGAKGHDPIFGAGLFQLKGPK